MPEKKPELLLTLYLQSGQTLRFERVTRFDLNPGTLGFDYVSATRNVFAQAVFNRHVIAGWSIGE